MSSDQIQPQTGAPQIADFDAFAANLPGAVFRYLLRADGSDAIEYMSSACSEIWEINSETLKNDPSPLWAQIVAEDLPEMQTSVLESAKTLLPWRHRWRIVTPSGQKKWLQGYGAPTALPDGGVLFHSFILDVTDQVVIEQELASSREQLFQAQKLDAVGKLTGGIAHDFNNLLAVLLGNLELLSEDPASDVRAACLADCLEAARRGRELNRSLLSFARKASLEPVTLDLNTLVQAMTQLTRRTLPAVIDLDVALEEPLWLATLDRGAVDSALLNLILNAQDAMPSGGKLTIETANVTLPARYLNPRSNSRNSARYVMLAVTDTGGGIARDQLERVTEPFFTTKPAGAGSGLGLSMVQGFVQQSGGALRIYSELGLGTTVKLFFPAAAADALPAPEETTAPATAAPGARILIAEDEPAVRRITAIHLREAGHHVTEASDGDEAYSVFQRRGPFDLVLTDVVMTGQLQGPHLAAALRDSLPDLPVVFMSGYPGEASTHARGVPASDIKLMKPVDRSVLLAAVAEALQGKPPA